MARRMEGQLEMSGRAALISQVMEDIVLKSSLYVSSSLHRYSLYTGDLYTGDLYTGYLYTGVHR